jgi:photosystem II Psb27 protein
LNLAGDDANKADLQNKARQQINDYISRYRRNGNSGGLKSFTTMQTALNSLAGYYTAYGSRPVPEKLKTRLQQEFKQASIAVQRGS